MSRLFSLLAVALLAGACATAQGRTDNNVLNGGDRPNVLVFGEDADRDSVPRSNRVFKRVRDALANEMNGRGFNVYDETAVTAGFAQGRNRRTSAEIIHIARSVKRPPIGVAVIFTIHASTQQLGHTTKIWTRITGRLLNVHSGARLGYFEVERPRPDNAPADCNRLCVLEAVGRSARELGMDLGAVLAAKLNGISAASGGAAPIGSGKDKTGLSTAYTLVFSGFTPEDITAIETYITALKGYEHHRPVSQSLRIYDYWYETSSKAARLSRNLRHMLDEMGIKGRIAFAGNRFTVEKIASRKVR